MLVQLGLNPVKDVEALTAGPPFGAQLVVSHTREAVQQPAG